MLFIVVFHAVDAYYHGGKYTLVIVATVVPHAFIAPIQHIAWCGSPSQKTTTAVAGQDCLAVPLLLLIRPVMGDSEVPIHYIVQAKKKLKQQMLYHFHNIP